MVGVIELQFHDAFRRLESGISAEEIAALIESGVVVQGSAKQLDPTKARGAKSRDVASG
jgi:hypothetical protein